MEGETVSGHQPLIEFRTDRAKVFQAIAKILEKNFIDATFMITEHGIFLQESIGEGNEVSIIFEIMLRRQKFLSYIIPVVDTPGSTVCLGFSTSDLKNAFDRITKTDSLRIFILASDPEILHLEIVSATGGSRTNKYITLKKTTIGHIIPPNYTDHMPTVVIAPGQFRKATADANKNSKAKVKIVAQAASLSIEGTGSHVRGLKDTFGNWIDGQPEVYNELISTQKLHSFSEIGVSNIAETIQVYAAGDGRPLKLSADAGSLGTVSMYLQSIAT